MDKAVDAKQILRIENRKTVEIDGVISVLGLTDEYLDISTVMGDISIEGNNLKIEELCKENGKIIVIGEINGIMYDTVKAKKGFFEALFK